MGIPLLLHISALAILELYCVGQEAVEPPTQVEVDSTAPKPKLGSKEKIAGNDTLATGDLIEISIGTTATAQAEFVQRERVGAQGTVHLPLLGEVRVISLNLNDASALIESLYMHHKIFKIIHVTMAVIEYGINHSVVVTGEVQKPGVYPVVSSMHLQDVLALAGGTTGRAGQRIMVVHRGLGDHSEEFANLNEGLKSMQNVLVGRGDEVIVERAGIVYVTGDVNKPGGFVMDNQGEISVLQALALAEGIKPTAALDRAELIRQSPTGREEVRFSLSKVLSGKHADVQLKANDIVFVPKSNAKAAMRRTLDTIIQTTSGVIIYSQHY
jgi:polysaccharide export outer membrane protein